jgi:hypothetical protein
MSKRFTWFVWLAFLFLLLTALVAMMFGSGREEANANTAPTEIQQATEYQTYIVREYNGMVAVFYSGQDKPFKVTDRYVSALPQQDINALQQGIRVDTDESLRKLLEDLCS